MDLQDVKNYIIRYNLDSPDRHLDKTDMRMYLYAYIYYKLKIDNLSHIGKMFCRGHATVRSALVKIPSIQFDEKYIENTKELNSIIPFIAPEYTPKFTKESRHVAKKQKEYKLSIKVTQEVFNEYMKKQKNLDVIFEYLLIKMIQSAPKVKSIRHKNK